MFGKEEIAATNLDDAATSLGGGIERLLKGRGVISPAIAPGAEVTHQINLWCGQRAGGRRKTIRRRSEPMNWAVRSDGRREDRVCTR